MEYNARATAHATARTARELQQARDGLAVSAAMAGPGSAAGALSELYRDAASGELLGPFIGRSVLDTRREGHTMTTPDGPFSGTDLEAERTELEHALGRFDPAVPDDVIARMRTRLDAIRAQLREMGQQP